MLFRKLTIQLIAAQNTLLMALGCFAHWLRKAPIGRKILENVFNQISTYSNLELDLNNGKRGNRQTHTEKLISYITGSDSALVVNNNAASVHLAVNEFAQEKKSLYQEDNLLK